MGRPRGVASVQMILNHSRSEKVNEHIQSTGGNSVSWAAIKKGEPEEEDRCRNMFVQGVSESSESFPTRKHFPFR